MKTWKLLAVGSNSPQLLELLKDYNYSYELPKTKVLDILQYCIERYSVCLDGYLRSKASNYSFDIKVIEEISAIEAYSRYGENAIFEVIDKGSFRIA